MLEQLESDLTLSRGDLFASMRLVETRAEAEAEHARLLLVRRLLAASFELNRALHAQTECALVNHCGTIGTRSLTEATATLIEAFEEYAKRCREAAAAARLGEQELGIRSWKDTRVVSGAAAVG